jgi:hypothetical protein
MPEAKSLEVGKNKILRTSVRGLQIVICVICVYISSSSTGIYAASIGEEFSNSGSFIAGTIVSLKKDNPKEIELSNINNSNYMLGVVVDGSENSVTFSKGFSEATVALSGDVQVLVSDANGEIFKGDFISASWLEGVGMRSNPDINQKLLGVALEDFDLDNSTSYGEIETPFGNKSIKVGAISIRIFEKEGPLTNINNENSGVQGLLEKVTGKQVSIAKVLAGSMLFMSSLLIAGLFITTSIRGSFVSIGRNPLSSISIYKSLLHVSGLSVLVVLIGAALSYVVLVI